MLEIPNRKNMFLHGTKKEKGDFLAVVRFETERRLCRICSSDFSGVVSLCKDTMVLKEYHMYSLIDQQILCHHQHIIPPFKNPSSNHSHHHSSSIGNFIRRLALAWASTFSDDLVLPMEEPGEQCTVVFA